MSAKRFFVTTAIDYPNGAPHVGHLYEKIVTDTYARWYRLRGHEVRFLTGTDENGQKLVKAAQEAGSSDTMSYITQYADAFRKLCEDLKLTHDDFIRTTEKRHIDATQKLWKSLEDKGDIYFGRYSGWYCLACEAFYTETQAPDKNCPTHGKPLDHVEEDGFFFRMSQYQDWILSHIRSHEKFIFPSSARKEILSRLEGEALKDLSVSRPNSGWGIPTPGRPDFVIYTWFDALINYYAADPQQWPASMHVIGKDITWFHTVIWPIMLKAAGLPLPEQVHVHGMVLAGDGKKMSKSLGNTIDPYDLIGRFSNDAIRYYMLRSIPSGQDGRCSVEDVAARHNNELANDFGNLALRVIKLAQKRLGSEVMRGAAKPVFDGLKMEADVVQSMEDREHNRALDRIWEFIKEVNIYLNQHEPWRIKDQPEVVHDMLYVSLYAIHCVATMLEAFIPEAAVKTLKMLGTEGQKSLVFGSHEFRFGETESLFPKIEITSA